MIHNCKDYIVKGSLPKVSEEEKGDSDEDDDDD